VLAASANPVTVKEPPGAPDVGVNTKAGLIVIVIGVALVPVVDTVPVAYIWYIPPARAGTATDVIRVPPLISTRLAVTVPEPTMVMVTVSPGAQPYRYTAMFPELPAAVGVNVSELPDGVPAPLEVTTAACIVGVPLLGVETTNLTVTLGVPETVTV